MSPNQMNQYGPGGMGQNPNQMGPNPYPMSQYGPPSDMGPNPNQMNPYGPGVMGPNPNPMNQYGPGGMGPNQMDQYGPGGMGPNPNQFNQYGPGGTGQNSRTMGNNRSRKQTDRSKDFKNKSITDRLGRKVEKNKSTRNHNSHRAKPDSKNSKDSK